MKETPGQIFAVVKWNMVWKKPSVHNPAKVKVNIYFRAQLITLPLRVLLYSYHSQTPIPHTLKSLCTWTWDRLLINSIWNLVCSIQQLLTQQTWLQTSHPTSTSALFTLLSTMCNDCNIEVWFMAVIIATVTGSLRSWLRTMAEIFARYESGLWE